MSLPQLIDIRRPDTACEISARWKVSPLLAFRIVAMAVRLPFSISIISGFRTRTQQSALGSAGRPTAAFERSTHTSCPATGADIWPTTAATNQVKGMMGLAAVEAGMRWGGGSPPRSTNRDPI